MTLFEHKNSRSLTMRSLDLLSLLMCVLLAFGKLFSDMTLQVGTHRLERATYALMGNLMTLTRFHRSRT